jgi:hypothetical protein
MLSLSRRAVVATGMVAAIAAAVPATLAATSGSQAQPADKAVAAGSTVQDVAPSATGTQLMQATFKTSKPEDLLMSLSLECSIITDVMVPGTTTPNGTSTGEAAGAVKVWLTIEGDGQPTPIIVPITDTSAPPQDPSQQRAGGEADKVTFCDRDHKVTVTDKENPPNGTDALEEYQFTKTANDFNWVRLNAGSGTHTVRVWAQFIPKDPSDPANAAATTTANSTAHGFVGNRTLIIEPTKLANNAVISDTATG